ncbi:MAG TPA: HIRAN domain-containing protein [Burkholderiales bacterium]|nr:HIRAN domain-containing protein [Burkholderiales bacterium]
MHFPLFAIFLAAALSMTPLSVRAEASIIVQQSPLAGFQYYDGKALWDDMKLGDALTLVRERDNPHDANAVRVEWNGSRLGYVPRRENADVARQMDRGAPVKARIVKLTPARNPWQRVLFEVYVDL